MKPNGDISVEWAKLLLLFGKKYCFTEKLRFLIDNLFGKAFLKIESYKLNNATVCETPMLNIFKLLKKVFSSVTVHRNPSFHNFHGISMF